MINKFHELVINMNDFKRYSIQTKMMIFFISIAVLLFITVGLLFFSSTELAINTSKKNELITLSYETANKIERFMFERYGDIQVMADSPLLKNRSISKRLKYDYLESVRKAYKTYDYIFITDEQGKIDVLSGAMNGDLGYKKWINVVLKGQTVVSDFTFDNKQKTYVVYFASPIISANKIVGTVVERMNFNAISDIVRSVKIGKQGYSYIYNEKGEAIFQPVGYNPMYKLPAATATATAAAAASNSSSIISIMHNNTKYVSAYYPIKKYGTQKNKWFLIVEEPYKEAFMVASNLRNYTFILIFISIIALFILAVIMSKIITKPIKKLVTETQRLALGNISQSIEVESKDEIGSLAISINTLLDNLKSMTQQVLDISSEAASLEEIRQYANRFFENVPSAIITVDRAGEITSINKTALGILGVEKEQMEKINIYRFKDNEEGKAGKYGNVDVENENPRDNDTSTGIGTGNGIKNLFVLIMDGIEKQIIYKKHITKITNSSGEILIMINTTIQKDSNGSIIGVIATFKPVDEIKQFEESVIRAKNLASLGELSAGMAHEIRNPLTSIKGYAQYIKSELKEEELEEDVTIIINEVDRLNGILDRFLIFARPQELKLSLADINNVVKDVVRLVGKEVSENIFVKEAYCDLPEIEFDPDQIEQALLNIVLNSIQAMPEGGKLSVATVYDIKSDFMEIRISDTGVGIPAEDFEKVFEPFYTTKEKGTGLGLAISSRIVEEHDGFLEVSSKQGNGTEFTIKLPVKKQKCR
jgi:nitrogen fixation/metabolism regulation signal transduction histidine kinase